MIDDLANLKAAPIGACGSHVREGYSLAPNTFAADLQGRDAANLIIQHANQVTLDTCLHLIHRKSLTPRRVLMSVPTLPTAPAARRRASIVRAPTLERGSHQTIHPDCATCIDGLR